AWEALEDAGYVPANYGGLIGLYAGSENSLGWESLAVLSGMAFEFGTWATSHLSDKDYLVTRVSHRLDLKGPAVTIQTACSTSLAAIHIAGRALLTGDCHIALAGGASVLHTPVRGYLYQEGMIFSPDGHCRAFDGGSQGTVMGEGVGVVVLKPLQTAISDGDHIHAIIKGSAINNDGISKQGFTAPSVQGQAGVIKAAQRIARVEPESIGYIETHGTGTSLGDPIEIEALNKAFNTKEKKFCGLGSVKTNLGHLGATAGVAGFIKTVLALKNRLIPPSLHFETSNPVIDFENSPFYVNTRLREWENNNGNPLRAGVSSFGIGGTNVHVILEEAPKGTRELAPLSKYHLILLSAKTPSALDKMTKNLTEYFKENLLNRGNHENPTNPGPTLADAAYTLQVGREAFAYRQVLGCASADEAVEALLSPEPTKVKTFQVDDNEPPVVFMFPGQGAQYVNMGRELYQKEPVFREEMDRCFEILKPLMGYDIKEILYPSERSEGSDRSDRSDRSDLIDQTGIAQPLLFVFEYSLAKLLLKWGIEPYAMIGHSIGEYVAACLSGVFLLEDALKLVSARGHLMQGLPPGAMLSVPLREEELQPLLELNGELSLAAVNSVSHCVVSGPGQAIDGFEKHLKEKGYSSRRLHTSHAFHSKMMDPILKEFEARVTRVELNEPRVPYISNVTGQWITVSQATSPGYWAGHLRETVRMGSGLGELLKKEEAVFVEVGPGRTLSTFVKQQANNKPGPKVINLVRHPRENTADTCYLLNKIGHLWGYGKAIEWKEFYRGEKRNRLPLPTYPFAGQRFWIEGHPLKIIAEIYHRSGLHKQDTGGMPGQTLAAPGSTAPPSLEFAAHPRTRHQRPQLKNEYTPPKDNIEKTLAQTWQNFLGIEKIGINDDLLELGADSLVFATVAAKIYKALQVNIPLAVFFNQPHIKGLAQYTRNAKKDIYYSIEPGEKKEYYVLSSPQQRLYVLSQLDKDSAAYNLPSMLILEGKIDKPRLENSFKTLVKRHDSLRTSFEMLRGEPIQKIHDDIEFNLDFHDLQALHDLEASQEVIRRFIQPFALPDAPLLRVALVKRENENHLLMVDMHHIISDGTSISLLIEEFAALYNGETLPPLRIQYKDFSGWQNRKTAGELIKEQEEYWLKEFADDIPILNLPTDFKRPVFQSFEGNAIRFELDKEETRALKTYALEEGVTLFMILLAAFNIFLAKITGQEDIIIGTPLAGRDHPDLHKIIGFFLNTLALRNYPTGNKTCKEFLQEIKQKTLASFENQEYPFESLVENLGLERDTSRNPIYSVMLILQISNTNDYWSAAQGLYGLKVRRYEHERNGSPNDISIYVIEREDGLYFSWEYCTRLFKKETSERYIQYFKKVISAVINTPRERISEISIITAEEKQWLLFEINN
ncbi:MAG: acyltransferase domain-containing protein, partial [Candidatus Aminicenantes bacterium]